MAITIQHRFIDRLSPGKEIEYINTLIIGTFNPGMPDKSKLTINERNEFNIIEESEKFRKFNLVKNFYDRAPNRFWGVMDRLYNTEFYQTNGFEARNIHGLKFYIDGNREETFKRQQIFCFKAGVYITDFVKSISPKNFSKIYDNFPDTQIEISNPVWNTEDIIKTINIYNPKKVLIINKCIK